MSHDATAMCSDCGEKLRSEIESSGGLLIGTSLEMSPCVLLALDVVDEALPKRPAIAGQDGLHSFRTERMT